MPNFEPISFKMAVLQRAGRICPPYVCVIQKTPRGTGLIDCTRQLHLGALCAGIYNWADLLSVRVL